MGVFGHFFSVYLFPFLSPSLGDGPIWTEILSQRAVKRKTTNQPTSTYAKSDHLLSADTDHGTFLTFRQKNTVISIRRVVSDSSRMYFLFQSLMFAGTFFSWCKGKFKVNKKCMLLKVVVCGK